ncbi:MAG: GAF domain-containing protein [Coriobacteriia bacterium]|nr:GAF domain-containing protein [Coriobacteriia bacterium]
MIQGGTPEAATAQARLDDVARLVRELLGLGREGCAGEEAAGEAAVASCVGGLGLSAAILSLAEDRSGRVVLKPVAAAGSHAPLTKHIVPAGFESMAETAQAFAERSAVFRASAHGAGPGRGGSGIARWREGIATQAYCLLPLVASGRPLGVLGLEWPEPTRFDTPLRAALESLADAVALLLASERAAPAEDRPDPPPSPAPPAAPAAAQPLAEPAAAAEPAATPMGSQPRPDRAACYEVDPSGGVRTGRSGRLDVLRLHFRTSVEEALAWWDVTGSGSGEAALAVCLADEGGFEADAVRHAFHALAAKGVAPEKALRLISEAFRLSEAPGARAALLVASVMPAQRALAFAAAGTLALDIAAAGGHRSTREWRAGLLASRVAPETVEHASVLLPGDAVALRLALPETGEAGTPRSVTFVLDVPGAGGRPRREAGAPAIAPSPSGETLVVPASTPAPRVEQSTPVAGAGRG